MRIDGRMDTEDARQTDTHTHTHGHYSAMNKKESLPLATTWVNHDVTFYEISQAHKKNVWPHSQGSGQQVEGGAVCKVVGTWDERPRG